MTWFDAIKRQRRRKPKSNPANPFIGEKIQDKFRVENQKESPQQTRARPFVDLGDEDGKSKSRKIPGRRLINIKDVSPSLGGTARHNRNKTDKIRGKSKKNQCAMCSKMMAGRTPRYKKSSLIGLDADNIVYCERCAKSQGMDKFYRVRN